jgi:hypothetical protein
MGETLKEPYNKMKLKKYMTLWEGSLRKFQIMFTIIFTSLVFNVTYSEG